MWKQPVVNQSVRFMAYDIHRHGLMPKPETGTVALIGAAFADGQPIKGVEKAPDVFRESGVEAVVRATGWGYEDRGNVKPAAERSGKTEANADEYYDSSFVKNSLTVGASCEGICNAVEKAAREGKFVLTIGGDHGIACGTLSGIARARPDAAYLWIDAHADCNTPSTSPSGNYHGMPLAHVLGWFEKRVEGFEWVHDHIDRHGPIPERNCAIIALRDVDEKERELLKKSEVHVFTMTDVDRHGIGKTIDMALSKIDAKGRRPLHVSCDVDSVDPEVVPGTGTLVRGGLSYREAHYIMEQLAQTGRLGSIDFVEVNPVLDVDDNTHFHGDDPNIKGNCKTTRFALGLVASVLGKAII